ncbi:Superkiller protein 3 [Sorochytrium milnesiophthora]
MSTKALLKQARECLVRKQYEDALDVVQRVLDAEPDNVNALLFRASACQNLNRFDESERALLTAVRAQEDNVLAWQGLEKLYEKTKDNAKWADALQRLVTMYTASKDGPKLLESVRKLTDVYKEMGDNDRWAQASRLLLPGTETHAVMSAAGQTLPPPADILKNIAATYERADADTTRREVELRRRRLGAGPLEQTKLQVAKEVTLASKVGSAYKDLLYFSSSLSEEDVLQTRTRLIAFLQQTLEFQVAEASTPSELVSQTRHDLLRLCEEAVRSRRPISTAYRVVLDLCDCSSAAEYHGETLNDAASLLEDDVGQMARALIQWTRQELTTEETATALQELVARTPNVLFGQYAVLLALRDLRDDAVLDVGAKCSALAAENCKLYGVEQPTLQTTIALASADCHLRIGGPNLPDAIALYRQVLEKNRSSLPALLGLSAAFTAMRQFQEARKCAVKVLELDPQSHSAHAALGWADFQNGQLEAAEQHLRTAIDFATRAADAESTMLNKQLSTYQCKLGFGSRLLDEKVLWASPDEQKRSDKAFAFAHFIQAAQLDPQSAEPFVYLGHYYREHGDHERAFKCYLKAYNLDPKDSEDSGHYLCQYYIQRDEEAVAVGVLRSLTQGNNRKLWAWKMLGYAELETGDHMSAVACFQTAVRIDSNDKQLWIGLGDGYVALGKYTASVKAFQRALELDPTCTLAACQHAFVQLKLGAYSDSIASFQAILQGQAENEDGSVRLLVAKHLADAYLAYAKDCLISTRYAACGEQLNLGVGAVWTAIQLRPTAACLWKLLGELLWHYCRVPSQTGQFDQHNVLANVRNHKHALSIVGKTTTPQQTEGSNATLQQLLLGAAHALSVAITLQPLPHVWYDLAVVLYCSAKLQSGDGGQQTSTLALSLKCVKHAVKNAQSAADDQLWNGMGVVAMLAGDVRLSQHCFIKANPVPWANLGVLYIQQQDKELANQAFIVAQTNDPDYVKAWLGQAVVADLWDSKEALDLFIHSFELSQGSEAEANFMFATRILRAVISTNRSRDSRTDIHCESAMRKYLEVYPYDAEAWNALGLLLEHSSQYPEAATCLERSQALFAQRADEAAASQVAANLGRVRCSLAEFDASAEAYMQVSQPTVLTKLGLGIALFFGQRLEESLHAFQDALTLVEGLDAALQNDVSMHLAQVLSALGAPQHIELATDQLLQCVARSPTELRPYALLCALGVATDNLNLTASTLQEFANAAPERLVAKDPSMHGAFLLSCFAQLQGDTLAGQRYLLKAIHRSPSLAQGWRHLAQYLLQHASHQASAVAATTAALHELVSNDPAAPAPALPEAVNMQAVSALIRNARTPESKRQSLRSYRMRPTNPNAQTAVACALLESPRGLPLANHHLHALCESHPDNRFYQLLRASALTNAFRFTAGKEASLLADAVGLCETVVTSSVDDDVVRAHALRTLGKVLWTNGDHDDAVLALRNAVETSPAQWAAWIELASLYFSTSKHASAEAVLATCLQAGEQLQSPTMQALAALQLLQQRAALGASNFTEALSSALSIVQAHAPLLSGLEPVIRALHSVSLLRSRQEPRAIKMLQTQVLARRKVPWAHYLLSYAHYSRKELDLAATAIDQECAVSPVLDAWRNALAQA